MLMKKEALDFLNFRVSWLGKEIGKTKEKSGCKECKLMDAAMRVMSALQFRHSDGVEAMGQEVNFHSAIAFDRDTQEIVINEELLMQAIIFANPGQKRRKIRLVPEEVFERYKKGKFTIFADDEQIEEEMEP